ncbi:Thymidylate kinase [Baekduia alba]|uniref:dTMP kinase n=1 Tax=Baekduia alba TaxID=2997333 RepID=UPI00234207AE|nr:dTMP kinase [Baekduia alba]WCB96532.1 Thymidylate kinase [Baekduia alba]
MGRLIAIEGIDGAGKTTLARGLVEAMPELVVLREPGGAEVSERIRALVADPALDVDPRAEALLFAAARAQLVAEVVRPLLADDRWVVLDRYVDSSLAYQGAGRELGVDAVAAINAFGTGGLVADLTLYVRVEPAVGAARLRGGLDRIEQAGAAFFAAAVAAYDALAAAAPERYVVLDGSGAPETVLLQALTALKRLQ